MEMFFIAGRIGTGTSLLGIDTDEKAELSDTLLAGK